MKRFYKEVSVEAAGDEYSVLLDGRPIKTPRRADLVMPTAAMAEAVAAEWREQGEDIAPEQMPMMRYAATTIDRVAPDRDDIIDIISAFAGHDLLCYRGDDEILAARQAELWQPLLDWSAAAYEAPLNVTAGIVSVDQPPDSLARLRARVAAYADGEVAALHVITSLSGSLVIALALAADEIDAAQAWTAAAVDETYQAEKWGLDGEAEDRLTNRRSELDAAQRYLTLCRG